MLAFDKSLRPTAEEVERRCRALRHRMDGEWLAEWAERTVSPLMPRDGEGVPEVHAAVAGAPGVWTGLLAGLLLAFLVVGGAAWMALLGR
jgi:hypothetical protein